jgi:hypothetical protein
MRRFLSIALLVLGLGVATWGLSVTVPALAHTLPGYLAKPLYAVLAWALIWIACAAGLVHQVRRRGGGGGGGGGGQPPAPPPEMLHPPCGLRRSLVRARTLP